MAKRYICEQACFLGGKRYEAGEDLADGVEPNSHFKDTQTGERAKAKKSKASLEKDPVSSDEVDQKIEAIELEVKKQLDEFKTLVGDHLGKFEKRIAELEKTVSENKILEQPSALTKQSEVPVKQVANKG